MRINDYHPNYEEFIKNEAKTLSVLSGFTQIQSLSADLFSEISSRNAFYRTKISSNQIKNTSFSIGSSFNIEIENDIYLVIIEGLVEPGFTQSTYAFSICKINNDVSKELIRKYHFDYAPTNEGMDRKSLYHLQYGGESTPVLRDLKISVDSLHPYLSPPRLEMVPMNLAILLDNVFCECYSYETISLIEKSEWRDLIKNNECFLYEHYFKNINNFFSQQYHKSSFLYRDLRHGKTK